jgi:hypothetical protein
VCNVLRHTRDLSGLTDQNSEIWQEISLSNRSRACVPRQSMSSRAAIGGVRSLSELAKIPAGRGTRVPD